MIGDAALVRMELKHGIHGIESKMPILYLMDDERKKIAINFAKLYFKKYRNDDILVMKKETARAFAKELLEILDEHFKEE